MLVQKKCAFICFMERSACEKAFNTLYERLFYQSTNKKLKLLWAKAQLESTGGKKNKTKSKPKQNVEEQNENDG